MYQNTIEKETDIDHITLDIPTLESSKIHLDDVLQYIPKEEVRRILRQPMCELDADFMGFTDIYKALASIIPKHFTVVDLGCYCAAQSYYFTRHAKYIGVDVNTLERFTPYNATHYVMRIQDFCKNKIQNLDLETTFAICSYVPDEGAKKIARQTFKNIYVYYPAREYAIKKE